jgi:cell division septum initiation protein DivIVA
MLKRLRSPELARSLRGFDETDTRRLLEEAATALKVVYEERDRLRKEAHVAALNAAAEAPDIEAIGRALITATATGEQIVADAQERAEHLVAQAAAEADAIRAEAVEAREQSERETADERAALEREREEEQRRLVADRHEALGSARAEADRLIAQARAEVQRLRREAEEIAAFMESKRSTFVEMAGMALEELERMERRPGSDSDLEPLDELAKPVPPVR